MRIRDSVGVALFIALGLVEEAVDLLREIGKRVLALAFGVLLAFGCLEVAARLRPVYEGRRVLPVNDANPIFRLQPNRDFVWSAGWNFAPSPM